MVIGASVSGVRSCSNSSLTEQRGEEGPCARRQHLLHWGDPSYRAAPSTLTHHGYLLHQGLER